ncbi:hypothetical protein AA0N74_01485 [Chromobacterium vaccinii]|uniref:hypothetical protein n=1 Tax=Chromobacterium vaccinii TaxID=1108595 RepID=UPI0031DD5067
MQKEMLQDTPAEQEQPGELSKTEAAQIILLLQGLTHRVENLEAQPHQAAQFQEKTAMHTSELYRELMRITHQLKALSNRVADLEGLSHEQLGITEEVNKEALMALVAQWENRARGRFLSAKRTREEKDTEKTSQQIEFEARDLEGGAMLYFNCASEIRVILNTSQIRLSAIPSTDQT